MTNSTDCAIIKVQKREREFRKLQKSLKKLLTNSQTCGIINTEREVRNIEQKAPRRSNKQDRIAELLKRLEQWQKDGLSPEEAVEKLTPAQYDFLIDNDINVDDLILSPEQQKAAKEVMKAPRTCKSGGYNKKYPQAKQDLYNGLVDFIKSKGGEIAPREKQNFRDLDFTIDGTAYRIVLSNPRK